MEEAEFLAHLKRERAELGVPELPEGWDGNLLTANPALAALWARVDPARVRALMEESLAWARATLEAMDRRN